MTTGEEKITQRLSSGLTIRQHFGDSVRFLMFETDVPGWEYATHGGTAFVVNYRGKFFGIMCKHCLGDFTWRQLALTDQRFGRDLAGLKAIYYPSNPSGAAVDSDILDIAVVRFSDDVGADFFKDRAYIVDLETVTTSNLGDQLRVNGALKDESRIGDDTITPIFALLDFRDIGATSSDVAIREAEAMFKDVEFQRLTGLSGSPVFNLTQRKLCGVMVRGTLVGGHARMRYIDFADVMELLKAIDNGTLQANYNRTIARLEQP
ncbi:MAG: hypothetical protein AB7H66_03235 [Hyphomonadaceae bacterium]